MRPCCTPLKRHPLPLPLACSSPLLLRTAARNAFALYAGKKGSLTKTEFRDALCALGFTPASNQCPGGDLGAFLSSCGSLTKPGDAENDKLKVAISVFDKAGMGFIAAEEFANQAKILGEPLSAAEAGELLKLANDGKIKTSDFFTELTK